LTVEVRPCRSPEELKQALTPIWHFFGSQPTDERIASMVLEPERVHAASVDGVTVGGAGAFSFDLSVPGGRVPAAGVSVVGVLPSHRRRGVLMAMMRAQLDDVHERGEPVAYLWPSEATIYGRFGYGIASLAGQLELERVRASFAFPAETSARARLVDSGEALELFPALYERVAVETPGMFGRSRDWWQARVLADPEFRRQGGGELACVMLEDGGRPVGYALYRLHAGFEYQSSIGWVNVREALGVTPSATREIWRYLLDVDWMHSVKASLLPVDHPLFLLLAEPRRMRFTVSDGVWVRLVDVGAALSARTYDDGPPVVFDVRDSFCPWNEGRWRLSGGAAERTEAGPDVRLDVSSLGSVYLGGFTFGQLGRAGLVEELAPGAIAAADARFRTDRAPWCPEIF